MQSSDFKNRARELSFLTRQCRPDRAALVVLYGRRRTGKTSLLRHFARDRRSVVFVADTGSIADQLAAFSRVLFEALGEEALAEAALPSWEAAVRLLGRRAQDEPLFVVLDELSYLVDSDPSLPSVLQRLWDAELRHTRLHLVLCGSYVSFMESEILAEKNPLYGRRTGSWCLEPFSFQHARLFLEGWSAEEQVQVYGVFGGMPAWLERLDLSVDLRRNVLDQVLARGAPLYDEPRFLLMTELREPRVYFSICRAVALGRTTPNEIAQGAGLSDRGVVSRYLSTLRELRLVERRVPATERNPERTRRARYYLADPFLRTWFRFVLTHRSALELGGEERVYDARLAPHLDQHVSLAFEEIARQHLWQIAVEPLDRVGAWWRGPEEVDVVGVCEGGPLTLGEVKWSKNPVGIDILEGLVRKTPLVVRDLRAQPDELRYALWSRSGFTDALVEQAEAGGVALHTLDDLG